MIDKLSEAYDGIQYYNYEAKRTRDVGEDSRRNPENNFLICRWQANSQRLTEIRDKLRELLEEYLKNH